MVRLLTRKFIGEYSSNVVGTFEKFYEINQKKYKINLRETSSFTITELEKNIIWSDAIVLIYSEIDVASIK